MQQAFSQTALPLYFARLSLFGAEILFLACKQRKTANVAFVGFAVDYQMVWATTTSKHVKIICIARLAVQMSELL